MGMHQYDRYLGVKPYLPLAAGMTAAVILLPLAVVLAISEAMVLDSWALVATGIGLSAAAAGVGSALWARKPESRDLAFGELMLWGWWRRKRAEQRVARDAAQLGIDKNGRPGRRPPETREQQLQVLRDLNAALEAKDLYTHGHSKRVERHVRRTAVEMNLSDADIEMLSMAASLHDVGKIRVPDRVLRKPGPLDDHELLVLEEHVLVGAWMVSGVCDARAVAAVRHHHERVDGGGYPDGLQAHRIPLFARIIAVADAYDAMTSTRPYRSALSRARAIAALREGAGTQFDAAVVDAFIATLEREVVVPAGLILGLGFEAFRKVAVGLKRTAATSVAPAIGAVGAATIIGTALPPARAPSEPARPPVASPQTGAQLAPAPQIEVRRDGRTKPRAERERRERKRIKSGDAVPAEGSTADVVTEEVAAAPESGPEPSPAPPAQEPSLQPEPDRNTGRGLRKGWNDPQPDKGMDCAERRAVGKKRHCG